MLGRHELAAGGVVERIRRESIEQSRHGGGGHGAHDAG